MATGVCREEQCEQCDELHIFWAQILELTLDLVVLLQYIDFTVKTEKTSRINRLTAFYKIVFCSRVTRKCYTNVLVKSIVINDYNCIERRKEKNYCLDGDYNKNSIKFSYVDSNIGFFT